MKINFGMQQQRRGFCWPTNFQSGKVDYEAACAALEASYESARYALEVSYEYLRMALEAGYEDNGNQNCRKVQCFTKGDFIFLRETATGAECPVFHARFMWETEFPQPTTSTESNQVSYENHSRRLP